MQMLTERFGRWGQITTLAFLTPAGSLGYPIDSIIFGTGRGYVCKYTEDKSGVRSMRSTSSSSHTDVNGILGSV